MNRDAAAPDPLWAVVVPVRRAGKSRLDVPGVDRVALARAIALDTIAAAAACDVVAQVLVVSDDGALPLYASDIPGLRFIAEHDPGVPDTVQGRLDAAALGGALSPLNAAIARGIAAVPDGMPRAALLGDAPALRPDELADALRLAAAHDRTVVADAEGTGSTLVTAAADVSWASAFGRGSFAQHVALGCTALDIPDASSLHRDVDTAAQLDAAASLGLGPRTAALLGRA